MKAERTRTRRFTGEASHVDLPVAFPSGELIQEVWDRWLSFDPVVKVHQRLDNLRKLSGILLDAGSNDDYNLHWGTPAAQSRDQ